MWTETALQGAFGVACFCGGFFLRAHIQGIADKAASVATSVVTRATTVPAAVTKEVPPEVATVIQATATAVGAATVKAINDAAALARAGAASAPLG